MAKTPHRFNREFRRLARQVEAVVSREEIHKAILGGKTTARYADSPHGKHIVDAVLQQVKSGVGPGGERYAKYSPEYAKRIKKSGLTKFWLRGIGRTGRSGGMLDPNRFYFQIRQSGRLFLVWKAKDSTMGIYAEVHQDGNKTTPARTWMHLDTKAGMKAVYRAYQNAVDDLVLKNMQK